MNYIVKNREKKRYHMAFRRFLKGESCHYQIREYVSLNYLEMKNYIESKMIKGMTWENYGSYWVVDHIVPIRLFDVFSLDELKICWNYQNLMPLQKDHNLHKEGDLRFSKMLLENVEQTHVVKKLLEKINKGIAEMDIYIKK